MSELIDAAPRPMPARANGQGAALAALVLGAAAMGVSPTIVRLADVGPLASAFWRVCLALPVLWIWMRVSERKAIAPPRRFAPATILAGLAFAVDLLLWHLSIVHTSIANATFFATLAPLWVVIFGWLLFRERVGRSVLIGLGICLLGGAALVSQSLGAAPGHAAGDLLAIGTGICFGLYFLAVRAARASAGAARVTFELSLIVAILLAVVALVAEPRVMPSSAAGWSAVISLALVSHAGGQGLLSVALGLLPAVFSSLVIFLEAIIAAAIAWVVLGEPVGVVQAAGGVLIVIGIVVARPRKSAHTASN